ncbi:MAG TPA: efflux RND transporter periplasmic adaptor subunit [Rhodopila sp.]|uniref:efflux RND transporter periplasmic adaptor subunit n=1 Tax=Rhodopila sp. TaxID=2480087 RepID=UPI002CA85ABC|nr:efflux RND transporter periplasmic adaptor subunit [Rhodopila sp.]HVY17771.1 efflux RND transporter periplasmic adaptor subunit [Rhodopila sp.]
MIRRTVTTLCDAARVASAVGALCMGVTIVGASLGASLGVAVVGAAVLGSTVLDVPRALAQPEPPAVPVTVATITRQDVPHWLRGLGTVQAYYAVQLRPRVDGTLIAVPVKEGQDVKAGTLLALIDPRPYQATLDAALAKKAQDQAQLANAQADLTRYSALMHGDFASRQQVDTQAALVKQLTATILGDDAQIEAARLNLDFCHITAPFDGRVGLRNVDPGNFVRASEATPILSLVQLQPIAATFTLPQDSLPLVAKAMQGDPALPVTVYAGDDKTELDRGKLVTIDNNVDPSTGTIKLKATFPNPAHTLWPGQFVNARLLVGTDHDVVAAPAAAIQHGPNGLFVYKVQPGSAVSVQPIKVARQEDNTYIVTEGLDPGATVVVGGQSRLQNGARISVTDSKADSKPVQTARSGS